MFQYCLYAPLRLYADRFHVRFGLSLIPLLLLLIARDITHTPTSVLDLILFAWPMVLVFGWFVPLPSTHVSPPKAALVRR